MTLRPEYSLGHSAYNDFLFAPVGVEVKNTYGDGRDLSVLSALTRLQIDPWHEAARLADLPREDACRILVGTLARLTDVRWSAIDVASTARRLVALLPAGAVPPVPVMSEAATAANKATTTMPKTMRKSRRSMWLVWAVLAVATLAIFLQLQPDHDLEPSPRHSDTLRP